MQDSELLNRKKRRTSYIPLKSKKGCAREDSAVRGVMIIGAGTVSGKYLNYFSKNKRTRLIAVADPSSCVRDRIGMEYHPDLLVSDYKEVIERDDIHIVVVCTPHNLHYSVVIDSLEAGKDVICEKPLAVSVKEADEMINAADNLGKQLFVTLNMRFDNYVAKIKDVIQQGQVGNVFMARSAYLGYELDRLDDPKSWKGDLQKAGGGVLLDGGYHLIDLMNSCLGQAKAVQAMGGRYIVKAPNKGEDNISLLVEYGHNCMANLQVSFTACSPGCGETPTLRLEHEFFGDKGTMSALSGWDPIRGSQRKLELLTLTGFESIDLNEVRCPDMIDHLLDCILTGSEPLVTAMDARNACAVVEAAYKSIQTGRKINVDWR